jgi:hypothetical protein
MREHQAGADRPAVDEDGAGAARAPAADDLGAGQPDTVAQGLDEDAWRDLVRGLATPRASG